MDSVHIEKLVYGGQALGRTDNKIAFLWNALPGETVTYKKTKGKKNMLEGIAVDIITSSPERITPREAHFLSCSPWQIMSYEHEQYWKKEMAREVYSRVGGLNVPESIELASPVNPYGYRNKIEFSFAQNAQGEITLGFFERGGKWRYPIDGCELAQPEINETAHEILAWIRSEGIPLRSLKTIIVRSNQKGETLAAFFIKDELPFKTFPTLNERVKGFQIYLSNFRSPASVVDKTLYSVGQDFLTEEVRGVTYKFGLLSFFQVYPAIFEEALRDMAPYVQGAESVVDYYSGVGAIGLSLAREAKQLVLVESNEEAVRYAKDNIALNGITNAEAYVTPSEKALEHIDSEKVVIVDPPRAGLDKRVVDEILAKKPRRIIYLSCDLATHARDVSLLQAGYTPVFWKLYNFFPRTPHIEGLCILERKGP